MAKTPPIPEEQRSFADGAQGGDPADRLDSAQPERRDRISGLQSGQPGDDDVNLSQQGRQGNINENTHHQGYQQDR